MLTSPWHRYHYGNSFATRAVRLGGVAIVSRTSGFGVPFNKRFFIDFSCVDRTVLERQKQHGKARPRTAKHSWNLTKLGGKKVKHSRKMAKLVGIAYCLQSDNLECFGETVLRRKPTHPRSQYLDGIQHIGQHWINFWNRKDRIGGRCCAFFSPFRARKHSRRIFVNMPWSRCSDKLTNL